MPITRRHIGRDTLLKSRMQTITNTVNCVGVMGKGVALKFKQAHKANFDDYVRRCDRNEVRPGVPYVFPADAKRDKPELELILNFPTKNHWRNPSQIEWVERGLQILADRYQEWDIKSLALPPLGCGNGGLRWSDVWPLIQHHLGELPIEIEVWVPDGEEVDEPKVAEEAQLDLFSE
ncbi:macro domain-containing protein [Nocardioides lacusdianchii]|uniref:macro domain-containing protein n=1 Tax=Nocardioides lacusdianchii TaxID=2783664 RepID=UPI001CCB8356|nr:macro domain-containing protein [Nocardioides lacusdianchii]